MSSSSARRRSRSVDACRRAPCPTASSTRRRLRGDQVRIDGLSPSRVERADHELADRDRAAVREERPHAQVGVDALDAATCRRCRRAARVMLPKLMPLLTSGRVTARAAADARRRSPRARIARRSAVISSASISFRPRPNRCGASRLSGRVTTSPPKPAEPRGRPWHAAQLSARPAPMRAGRLDVADAVAGQRPWPVRAA